MTLPQLHYGRTDDPSRLIPVDRALADLRRGGFVGLRRGREAYLMLAGETVSDETLGRLRVLSGNPPRAAITPPRAAALGLGPEKSRIADPCRRRRRLRPAAGARDGGRGGPASRRSAGDSPGRL